MIIKVRDCAVENDWDKENEFDAWIRTEDIQIIYKDIDTGDFFARQYDAVGGEDYRIDSDYFSKLISAMEEDKN